MLEPRLRARRDLQLQLLGRRRLQQHQLRSGRELQPELHCGRQRVQRDAPLRKRILPLRLQRRRDPKL